VTQQFVDSWTRQFWTRQHRAAEFSPDAARAMLAQAQAAPAGRPRAQVHDETLPVGPTGAVAIRIIRPLDADQPLPVVMLFHGGAGAFGDADTHDRLMREIAVGARAAVVFVAYATLPEHPFATAVEQAYAATNHVAAEAARMNLDASRLAVLGDGIGGAIAALVTQLAKARRGPRIDLQVLLYPAAAAAETASCRHFAHGPWLTRDAMRWFREQCREDAPLDATLDQLRNLPEALVIVAENDVLRDEGEAYARRLSDAGVRVTALRYNGTMHDFALLHALADTPAARSAIAQVISTLKASFE
jgi:acetyl esterase